MPERILRLVPANLVSPLVITLVCLAALTFASGAQAQTNSQKLYSAKCAACHAPDGSGNTGMGKTLKVRDLRSPEVQNQSDDQLYEIIAKGKGKMPSYEKTLKSDEIKGLVRYIRSLPAKN